MQIAESPSNSSHLIEVMALPTTSDTGLWDLSGMRFAKETKCSECLAYKIIVTKPAYLRKLSGGQIQSITNPLGRSTQQAYNGIASNNNAIVPSA